MKYSTMKIIDLLPKRLSTLVYEIIEGRTIEGLQIPSNITAGEYLLLVLLERSLHCDKDNNSKW